MITTRAPDGAKNNLFIHIQITQCCIELCNILCNLKPLVRLHLIFTNFIIFTRQNPTTSQDVLVAFAKLTQDQWQGQSRTQWAHLLQVDFPNCDWWLRCRLHTMPPTVLPNLGCSLFKWELHGLTCTRPHQPWYNVRWKQLFIAVISHTTGRLFSVSSTPRSVFCRTQVYITF